MVKGQAFFNQLITGMYIIFSLFVGTFLYLCICQARCSCTNLITIHLRVHVCDYPCAFISVFSLCTKSLDHPPFILSTSSLTALILSSLAFFTLALYPFISLSCYHLPTPTAPLSQTPIPAKPPFLPCFPTGRFQSLRSCPPSIP